MNGFYSVYMHGENRNTDGNGVDEALSKMLALIAEYAHEDVCNMNKANLFYKAQTHKTLAQHKVKDQEI